MPALASTLRPSCARPLGVLLLLAGIGVLGGCTSASSPNAIMDRVEANRAEYETWPYEVKDAVLSGKVEKGMTPSMVLMARGKPAEKNDRGNGDEIWIYHRTDDSSGLSSALPSGTSVSIGAGVGGGYPSGVSTGVYLPPIVLGGGGNNNPAPYEDTEDQVVFRNGRVVHGTGVK